MIDLDIREMPVLGLLIVVLPVVLVAILVGPGGSLAMSCFVRLSGSAASIAMTFVFTSAARQRCAIKAVVSCPSSPQDNAGWSPQRSSETLRKPVTIVASSKALLQHMGCRPPEVEEVEVIPITQKN